MKLVELIELTKPLPFSSLTLIALIILLTPLLSFVLINAFKSYFKKGGADALGIVLTGLSFVLSVYLFVNIWNVETHHARFIWFDLSSITSSQFTLGVLLDEASVLMMGVVTLVSFLVHLFSVNYMKNEKHYCRYFAFLGLFTFSMLGIVLSDNLLSLFVFWELVGLSSYLLIGFWFERESAARASKKAFITNRVGDFGFLIGLSILFAVMGTLDIDALKVMMKHSYVSEGDWILKYSLNGELVTKSIPLIWLTISGLGLFCGVMGKSAQFPLQIWLPDAMQGPTPVSALIHAATMVAAGVYLLLRVFPILSPDALDFIAVIGAVTAFLSGYAALTQNDIKRVLAYSTSSQLGFMVMGIGVGAYDASFFHLITHAFFKAGLFLAAGAIIRSLHHIEDRMREEGHKAHFDVQDMRNMGGLYKKMPFVFVVYLVTGAALMGIPFFSGFLSKDAILNSSLAWAMSKAADGFSWHIFIPVLGFLSAFFTALYMTRQILLIFFGELRFVKNNPELKSVFETIQGPPLKKKVPLFTLAFLSLGLVFSLNPFNTETSWLYNNFETPELLVPLQNDFGLKDLVALNNLEHEWHFITSIISIIIVVMGIGIGYYLYQPKGEYAQSYLKWKPGKLPSVLKLSYYNWYLDDLMHAGFVKPTLRVAYIAQIVDDKIINRLVDSSSSATLWFSDKVERIDRLVLNPFIDLVASFNVWVADIAAMFDRHVIDGTVNYLADLTTEIGAKAKSIQGSDVQRYILVALVVMVFALLFVLLLIQF
ncbi:NADH-quinone oxidoreductase subunit L [Aureibacter tunicatorum]|uniref:NADH-quinone oxidoreductase subunit L n=1 Tax=Aureibacter tunicatorum TaxID=866807 RepID=A0AAE4BTJ6_9BACT|nr:NADH-quinone oxidoreductase subunit L [Aureibacter tunicatorum]MDR6239697.1 NADH-quinone oxidoreductase subunit L [Aureibacter tunicatorum]BDD04173.1 NADH-quinone oxidoreductase subunit L [Aureibacter tunicatorum]